MWNAWPISKLSRWCGFEGRCEGGPAGAGTGSQFWKGSRWDQNSWRPRQISSSFFAMHLLILQPERSHPRRAGLGLVSPWPLCWHVAWRVWTDFQSESGLKRRQGNRREPHPAWQHKRVRTVWPQGRIPVSSRLWFWRAPKLHHQSRSCQTSLREIVWLWRWTFPGSQISSTDARAPLDLRYQRPLWGRWRLHTKGGSVHGIFLEADGRRKSYPTCHDQPGNHTGTPTGLYRICSWGDERGALEPISFRLPTAKRFHDSCRRTI